MAAVSIKLYAADVSSFADNRLFSAARAITSKTRIEKTDRLLLDRDKFLSIGAEFLLRHALDYPEIDFDSAFYYGENGKPYLKNEKNFSLAHSGNYALCAVSDHEVGCDIEKIKNADLKVAKRFFTEQEYEKIAAADKCQQSALFYRYWVLKESFLKTTGAGLSLPLDSFEIEIGKKISVTHNFNERDYGFEEFSEIPGYACAVCTDGADIQSTFEVIDITELL